MVVLKVSVYFGNFRGFGLFVVILEVLGVFWSFYRFEGILVIFRFRGIFVILYI